MRPRQRVRRVAPRLRVSVDFGGPAIGAARRGVRGSRGNQLGPADTSARLLAERARALSDPTRLTLAAALGATDELCVCDLAWVSERAENLVSHHLRALRTAGLVTSRRDGKMVMYSLTEAGRSLLRTVLDRAEAPS